MRGQKLRLALWALAAALLLVYLWRGYRSPFFTVSFGDYCHVQRGMSRAEVEAVFGGPAVHQTEVNWPAPRKAPFVWEGCAGSADVEFDGAGKVVAKCYWPREDWDRADWLARLRMRYEWWRYTRIGPRIRE